MAVKRKPATSTFDAVLTVWDVNRKPSTPQYSRTGGVLRAAREKSGISQRGLATRAGIHQSDISSYETGKVLPELPRLARIIGITGADITAIMDAVLDDTRATP